ncbi:hypothetical protein Metok_0376 [Methanothermococcus okinawensis IH1]|uniref:Uncharacterized protein n=2 Tax=Methanothermococcus okinawensis TaxID=155863 RepID=F8AKN2_METOI|nr:hypothetical protein Metok_0376 [Methanothermococcus okinawensis IH1]
MIYYIVLVQGVPESYGCARSRIDFQKKKDLFDGFGCEIKNVSKEEFEKVKKKVDIKTQLYRKHFQLILGGENM